MSFWFDSLVTSGADDLAPRPALTGECEVDVAIVGAGLTGLWSAYYLLKKDPGLRVILLEKEIAGFGASGRNGGWCSALFP
ncbi:MAG: FAD-dependent oxidoreductase, partial [Terrimesophilobacter sp.]